MHQYEDVQKQHQSLSKVALLIVMFFMLTAVDLWAILYCVLILRGSSSGMTEEYKQKQYDGLLITVCVFLCVLYLQSLCYSPQVGHGLHPSNESVILHWVGQFPGQVCLFFRHLYPPDCSNFHLRDYSNNDLFVHPGATHRLLNRMGLSRRI